MKDAAIRESAEETRRAAEIVDKYNPFVERYITPRGEDCVCYMFFAIDKGESNNQCEYTHDLILTPFDEAEEKLSYDNLKNTWNSVKNIIVEILEENN